MTETLPCPLNLSGIDGEAVGECNQKTFVSGDVIEDAGEEPRLTRGLADFLRSNSAFGEEIADPVRIRGEKCKPLNRKGFRSLGRHSRGAQHRALFAFP
jgi:hypothetical protein